MGITDRGTLEVGMRADINVIDFERLTFGKPTIVEDLPEGSRRLLQAVSGYRLTMVNGVITREYDEATGQLPGRVLRHGRSPQLDRRWRCPIRRQSRANGSDQTFERQKGRACVIDEATLVLVGFHRDFR